jgi:anti-sigma factor RsiW
MKCEEFEAIGLNAEQDGTLSVLERAAAREHASSCSRCAALQDSWQAASAELRFFGDVTQVAQTPPRVEMRLRQEFRTQHRTLKMRRTAVIGAWVLATAALLVGAVSWSNWRNSLGSGSSKHSVTVRDANTVAAAEPGSQNAASGTADSTDSAAFETLVAENSTDGFTQLPGSNLGSGTEDAAIVRVRMQRGSLGALGLPVNEERAAEWIQVDLLLGNDGQPQAVRLPETQSQ